jgi:hypothetical protein
MSYYAWNTLIKRVELLREVVPRSPPVGDHSQCRLSRRRAGDGRDSGGCGHALCERDRVRSFRRHFPDWDRRGADRQPLAVMEQALTSDTRPIRVMLSMAWLHVMICPRLAFTIQNDTCRPFRGRLAVS